MKTYLIYSKTETDRLENVQHLKHLVNDLQLVEAIYPNNQKVPFLNGAMKVSAERTGQALLPGEVGCLLSHRAIWQKIINSTESNSKHFLILESDSKINDASLLLKIDRKLIESFDLFFWGAWDGHMQLFRKNRIPVENGFSIGIPFIKTIYCTYGYSLNKKTAKFLLEQTRKFSYPVDQYKRFMQQNDVKIGGIKPELISTNGTASNIRTKERGTFTNQLYLMVLDLKNYLICLFK